MENATVNTHHTLSGWAQKLGWAQTNGTSRGQEDRGWRRDGRPVLLPSAVTSGELHL